MLDLFNTLNLLANKEPFFWFCALTGSTLFIIQLIFNLSMGEGHDGMDDGSGEVGKFKWLSKQAVTGFLMMFGWIGLTSRNEFGLSGISSVILSLLGGFITIVIIGLLFQGAKKLRSSGTVFRIEDAIGKEATIYQRIPKQGVGKISVSLSNFTHEIDAMSLNEEELPSFTSVQIIKKLDEKTVAVIPMR